MSVDGDSSKDNIRRKGYYLVSKSTHHHEFTICNWTERQKENKICHEFTIGNDENNKFRVEIYPHGLDEESMDYISAKLVNLSPTDQTGHFKLGLLKNDQEIMNVLNIEHEYPGSKTLTTEDSGGIWVITNFASRSYLKQTQAYTSCDSITVTIDVTLIDEPEFVSKVSVPLACLPTGSRAIDIGTLSEDVTKLFNNPLHSDITLCSENVGFYCHKAILSIRSPYFNEKFTTWNGQLIRRMFNSRVYVIKKVSNLVIAEVLRFIYTDACKADILDTLALDILKAAIKYQLPGLVALCEDHLISSFDTSNMIEYYITALFHNLPRLRKTCEEFYRMNFSDIELTEVFMAMNANAKKSLVDSKLQPSTSGKGYVKFQSAAAATDIGEAKEILVAPTANKENKNNASSMAYMEPTDLVNSEDLRGLMTTWSKDLTEGTDIHNRSTKSLFLNDLSEDCKPVSMILKDRRVLSLGLTYSQEDE